MNVKLLGYACGVAAGDSGTASGPVKLFEGPLVSRLVHEKLEAEWLPLFYPVIEEDIVKTIAEICTRLAKVTNVLVKKNEKFAVFAGDHSCAIGTWSGVSHGLRKRGDVGLIWIDAHLDSHTPETSPSGNIHGMPAAVLLGYGDKRLIAISDESIKIKPENICFIGIRSYESGEKALLEKLKVKIYYIDEVKKRGLNVVLQEAKEYVSRNTAGFGLSIDVDSIDPHEAPGVGTPAADGLNGKALSKALQKTIAGDQNFLGVEITEYNPHRDIHKLTEKLIIDLFISIFRGHTA